MERPKSDKAVKPAADKERPRGFPPQVCTTTLDEQSGKTKEVKDEEQETK